MDNMGHISCEHLLQKANELLKAALQENKVKQLALDNFSSQLATRDHHIETLTTIIQRQHADLQGKDALITSLNTTVTLFQQTNAAQSDQLALQQQIISKMGKAALEYKKKLERQEKVIPRSAIAIAIN